VNDRIDQSHSNAGGPAVASNPRSDALSERVRSLRLKEKPKRQPARFAWLPWTLCLALAGSSGYLAYNTYFSPESRTSRTNDELNSGSSSPGSASAKIQDAVSSSGDVVLERKGYIIPAHQILLSPKVSAVILEMNVMDKDGKYKLDKNGNKTPLMEGLRVDKDDILAVLEDTDYQTDYDRCVATVELNHQQYLELKNGNRPQEIDQAEAELKEMEANKKQLELDYRRSMGLRTSSSLADKDYELAEGQYQAMARRVVKMRLAWELMKIGPRDERKDAAKAQWGQSKADMAKAKWRLDNCKVRAPISGTILTKKAEVGNLVNPVAFAGSQQLCEMADLSDIEVDMSIEERDVSKVFVGQRCKVRAEAFPERVYDGIVSRLMPTADRAKSAIPVRVKLTVPKKEEGVYLKPEMGAVVFFLKKTDK
jgi:HlyD family secretion protein